MDGANPPGREATLRRSGVGDLERRLSGCTELPRRRREEFRGWSASQIRSEAQAVTELLRRFAEAVVRSMDRPQTFDDVLRQLDLKTISRDHDWRSTFRAIRDLDGDDAPQLKRVAFIRYLQYLSSRKRLLDHLHLRKAALGRTDELPGVDHPREAVCGAPELQRSVRAGFERVAMGETVPFELAAEDTLELVLGRNVFELVGGPHPYLVDENGVTCFVKTGRNVVGRHPESDVVVDANFSHVSRAHLILEWDGQRLFSVMDLSSRGTWLESARLRRTRSAAG